MSKQCTITELPDFAAQTKFDMDGAKTVCAASHPFQFQHDENDHWSAR